MPRVIDYRQKVEDEADPIRALAWAVVGLAEEVRDGGSTEKWPTGLGTDIERGLDGLGTALESGLQSIAQEIGSHE